MKRNTHPRPSDTTIKKVIRKAKKLVKAEPDDLSAGYRRGLAEALAWVLGENTRFDKLEK